MNNFVNILKSSCPKRTVCRNLNITSVNRIKNIYVEKDENQKKVKGVLIESDRKTQLIDTKKINGYCCPICALNLKVKYTDVLILEQYLGPDNDILPVEKTNLCNKKYSLFKWLISKAQTANLLPKPAYKVSYGPWEKLNTYFDIHKNKRGDAFKMVKPEYWN